MFGGSRWWDTEGVAGKRWIVISDADSNRLLRLYYLLGLGFCIA